MAHKFLPSVDRRGSQFSNFPSASANLCLTTTMLAQSSKVSVTRSVSVAARPTVSRRCSVIVRAEEAVKAPAAPKAAFVVPTLNTDAPSPIFGGSTGGLLRKAQVRVSPNPFSPRPQRQVQGELGDCYVDNAMRSGAA